MKKRMKNMFKHHGHEEKCCHHDNPCGNGIYFFGMVGAAIYYIQTATSFWGGVLGLLKALVWPAFVVYESLKFLLG
jgi:phage gp29-like protein